jgi:hypothetical protein
VSGHHHPSFFIERSWIGATGRKRKKTNRQIGPREVVEASVTYYI